MQSTILETSHTQKTSAAELRRAAVGRATIVLLGIIIGQFILYGPSLVGTRVMLPLRVLAEPPVYYPTAPDQVRQPPHDYALTDLIFFMEPERSFAASEVSAGRLPLWTPYRFGGSPCWPLGLSPPWWPAYAVQSPVVLAWTQMLVALVAGTGAYIFFRRVLNVSFWPAAFGAWCYPVTGAFVVWTGFWLPAVICWMPWIFWSVYVAIRRTSRMGIPFLAVFVSFIMIGGAEDIAGQVLIASGLFAIWCIWEQHGFNLFTRPAFASIAAVTAGWLIGILASTWLLLPLFQYVGTGTRMISRSEGAEERPPVGIVALPELLLPDIYGSSQHGSVRLISGAYAESAVGGYAGLLAALLATPLAWLSVAHRRINGFWIVLIFISVSWTIKVPGMVWLLRLPGLNMMSHNRFVFVAAFGLMSLATTGLHALWNRRLPVKCWVFALPIVATALIVGWNLYRALVLPEPLRTEMEAAVAQGAYSAAIRSLGDVSDAQHTFTSGYLAAAMLGMIALIIWAWILLIDSTAKPIVIAVGCLMVVNLHWFAFGRAPQSDPSLYGKTVPLLDQLAKASDGRVIGFDCLPANVAQFARLRDIRGYDGIDPAPMIDLLRVVATAKSLSLPHAITQWLTPYVTLNHGRGATLAPILNMLNVRYVIFRGTPIPGVVPDFQFQDYWAVINDRALPRVYVPANVVAVGSAHDRLRILGSPEFDPRYLALVESPGTELRNCKGDATIVEETPTHITIKADLQTSGLLVLADAWDAGWHARMDGKEVPILRTNHAIRGVSLPAGVSVISFNYRPKAFVLGSVISFIAWGIIVSMAATAYWRSWRQGLPVFFHPAIPQNG